MAISDQELELTIGEAAARTGLTAHTLRYYEQAGLIGPVQRGTAGERRYAPEDLQWIDLLRHLRATGMPIRDVRRFMELRRHGRETLPERRALLEAHRRAVEQRIGDLMNDLDAIDAKLARMAALEEGG